VTAKEITKRFPTKEATLVEIARTGSEQARHYFAVLTEGLPSGHVVVAHWTKPQFSNVRTYPVRSDTGLSFVLGGIRRGHCTNLRFFVEDESHVPPSTMTYRNLFLP